MVFRWRANDDPHIVVFGSSLPSSIKKKSCQSWTPFWIRARSWAIMFYVMRQCTTCYPTLKTARGMKAADLIFMSAADIISWQVWPRPGPTKCLMFVFITKALIRMCGTQVLVSYNKVGVNIYRRVVRIFANSDMYFTADDLKVFCCFH